MPRTPNTYLLQGKSIFLTYPRCPLTTVFVLDYIWRLLAGKNITYVRVAQESHQDGEPHLHCLAQLGTRFNTRNARFFDLADPNGTAVYHPNTQVPRSDAHVADYIAKGGSFEERGVLVAARRSPKKTRDQIWAGILNESTSKSDFLDRCRREQPFTFATQLRNLEYAASKQWPEPPPVYQPRWTSFAAIPAAMEAWALNNCFYVSLPSLQLTNPYIDAGDIQWAHELTIFEMLEDYGNIIDILETNRSSPPPAGPRDPSPPTEIPDN